MSWRGGSFEPKRSASSHKGLLGMDANFLAGAFLIFLAIESSSSYRLTLSVRSIKDMTNELSTGMSFTRVYKGHKITSGQKLIGICRLGTKVRIAPTTGNSSSTIPGNNACI